MCNSQSSNLRVRRKSLLPCLLSLALLPAFSCGVQAADDTDNKSKELFAKENLVAWCIVPFDAKSRGPEERAVMLSKLGVKRVAYDWRAKDIPTFDAEIDAYEKHGITLEAFWTPVRTNQPLAEAHVKTILDLVKRRHLSTQLWVMLDNRMFDKKSQDEKIGEAVKTLRPLAEKVQTLNCRIGLYNHGGWFGQPENQMAIIDKLHMKNVGMVYNFHHAHEHLDRMPGLLKKMTPYLIALNLNGMTKGGPKIISLGKGKLDKQMIEWVRASGYQGPIGILDHRKELDAEISLRENLEGLETIKD